jgi:CBS domain-containing protein
VLVKARGTSLASREPVRRPDDLLEHTSLSRVMRTDVITIAPSASLRDVRELLLDHGISGAPVVDTEGRPLGMVSKTDLLRCEIGSANAKDIMTPLTVSLGADSTVAHAAALMVHEGIHRIVVVGADGRVTGLVTPLDILRAMAVAVGYTLPAPAHE